MAKRVLIFVFIFFFILVFKAEVNAEVIRSFDVVISAQKDGKMNIEETIVYDFESDERHGIFRYIPLYSRVGDLYRIIKVDNVEIQRDGEDEEFEKSQDTEQVSFKIGDPDKTISGPHTYKVFYTVENGIGSNYETHDEIYWNATGNDWHVEIEKASARINADAPIERASCFTRGADLNAQFCTFPPNVFNRVTTTSIMYPGDGLTVVLAFPKGTFPPSTLVTEPPKTIAQKIGEFILRNILLIYLALNILIPAVLFFWYQRKKNKTKFGKPAVNFDIPKDESGIPLTPALAGTIDTAKLERDDVTATLFDLAIRKYIRLEEIKETKSLLPDSKKQLAVKLKDGGGLNAFEKELFDRLFKLGDKVEMDTLKKDFYKTYTRMEEEAFKTLVDKKYFVKNPKVQRAFLAVFAGVALFTANIFLAAILFFLSRKLIGRTTLGDGVDHKIDGLKLFLKSMDRNYNWQAEKFITIEQMIPYAMALGYIDKFMDQLKIIDPDYKPTWYKGYSGSFYSAYSGFYSSTSSNMTTSAPSSSSGFSGGSSGGGGGGGGGGSW